MLVPLLLRLKCVVGRRKRSRVAYRAPFVHEVAVSPLFIEFRRDSSCVHIQFFTTLSRTVGKKHQFDQKQGINDVLRLTRRSLPLFPIQTSPNRTLHFLNRS
jgi:hypothetical protein